MLKENIPPKEKINQMKILTPPLMELISRTRKISHKVIKKKKQNQYSPHLYPFKLNKDRFPTLMFRQLEYWLKTMKTSLYIQKTKESMITKVEDTTLSM